MFSGRWHVRGGHAHWGGGVSVGPWSVRGGISLEGGVDFSPHLVDGWQGGDIHGVTLNQRSCCS